MSSTSTIDRAGSCPHCSGPNSVVFHGGPCPRVKAIEYHPTGTVKRVEFFPAPDQEDR